MTTVAPPYPAKVGTKTRLTIAYVTMQFPAPSETFVSGDIQELSRRGHNVSVYVLRARHPKHSSLVKQRNLTDTKIEFFNRPALLSADQSVKCTKLAWHLFRHVKHRPRQLAKAMYLTPRAIRIFNAIQKQQPDVVHLAWGHYPAIVGHLLQTYAPHIPLSISFSAYDLRTNFPCSSHVARRASVVRTLSVANVHEVRKKFKVPSRNISVIPDGLNLDLFKSIDALKDLNLISSGGRLVESKGFDDVLRAFEKAKHAHPQAQLVIFGDGPERESLENQAKLLGIEEAVTFTGFLTQKKVSELLSRSGIFLFMSHHERLPNVIKEAMATSCACVTTTTNGINELIPSSEIGRIVNVGDFSAAAEEVVKLLSAKNDLRRIGRQASEYIYKHYDRKKSVDQYLELWSSLSSRSGHCDDRP